MNVPVFRFKPEWWDECVRIAAGRLSNKGGIPNSWVPRDMSAGRMHLVGVAGEAAVCALLGSKVNRVIHMGDRHAPDLYVGDFGIEVKATKYAPPHLKMRDRSEFNSHIAVVVHVNESTQEAAVWGWVEREDFFKRAVTNDYGYGKRLVMRPPFNSIFDLKRFCSGKC